MYDNDMQENHQYLPRGSTIVTNTRVSISKILISIFFVILGAGAIIIFILSIIEKIQSTNKADTELGLYTLALILVYSFPLALSALITALGLNTLSNFFLNLKCFSKNDTLYLEKYHHDRKNDVCDYNCDILELKDRKGHKLFYVITKEEKEKLDTQDVVLSLLKEKEFYYAKKTKSKVHEITDQMSPDSFEIVFPKLSFLENTIIILGIISFFSLLLSIISYVLIGHFS